MPTHNDLANAIRALAMDAVQAANSGHPGMPMGMADVATVLFGKFLKFDPTDPAWPDRDRFVLSAGHGSMLLYALLHLTGYEDMTIEQLKNFRQLGSRTAGHPEHGHATGIETTTGPLGQGLANAVGMALAERQLRARFGEGLVDHRTYVIASDGDLMEGISHEACSFAGHQRLDRLIVLYDDNQISIDGSTSLAFSDDTVKRFAAYGWHSTAIDGHDPAQVEQALRDGAGQRPADPDRLPHRDRLRRADQGRHRQRARLAARRRGDRGGARAARLAVPGLRGAGADPRGLARDRPARRRARGPPGRRASSARSASVKAEFERVAGRPAARGARPAPAGAQAQAGRGEAELGDPQGEPGGAAGAHRRDPGDDRRLGRPHPLQQHRHQVDARAQSGQHPAAATSTTACASTRWPRR